MKSAMTVGIAVLGLAVAVGAQAPQQGAGQQAGRQAGQASCQYFVDADGDGVCDNIGAGRQGGAMRGRGMRGMQGMRGFGGGMAFGPNSQSLVDLTAKVTGTAPADVVAALHEGKTFAQIAGGSVDALKQAVIAERQEAMAKAVSEGRLTQEQADAMTAQMTSRLDQRLNGAFPMGRGRGAGFHRGAGPVGTVRR